MKYVVSFDIDVVLQTGHLYPNAALKMITQATTAFGVCGTSMYIHHPVNASAMPILAEVKD